MIGLLASTVSSDLSAEASAKEEAMKNGEICEAC